MAIINQYEIVLVNLDPTVGSEIKKTRPCVVLSPNEMNKYLRTLVIAPITNTSKAYPTRVEIKGKSTKGWVLIDQIRTIDRMRVTKSFGMLDGKEIIEIKNVIKEAFVE